MDAPRFPTRTAEQILDFIPEKFPWYWEGFLRPAAFTLFSCPPRIGKSTLVSLVLDRMAKGGMFAGRKVKPCKVFVASEETDAEWAPRIRRLNLAGHVEWSMHPFQIPPREEAWLDYVKMMVAKDADVYVVDSLQHFLPANSENSVTAIRRALSVFKLLTRRFKCVWALHHPKKDDKSEFSFRGTSALQACTDILMELRMPAGANAMDRRRLLHVKSRYDPKPRVFMELNEEQKGYTVLDEPPPSDAFETGWKVLAIVLEDADERLTTARILEQWPADYDKPSPRNLRRWLQRAIEDRTAERFGNGRFRDPYRYALPGRVFAPKPESSFLDVKTVDRAILDAEQASRASDPEMQAGG